MFSVLVGDLAFISNLAVKIVIFLVPSGTKVHLECALNSRLENGGENDQQDYGRWGNGGGTFHKSAIIDPSAFVEVGAVVHSECAVGADCHIGSGAVIGPSVTIGQSTKIG